ncbi:hypothetical protein [Streptomyces sp. YIM S03343]
MTIPYLAQWEDQQQLEWILITSEKADLLLIATPGGLEKMFRHAGRDLREPRPEGFEFPAQLLVEAAGLSGSVVLCPPR